MFVAAHTCTPNCYEQHEQGARSDKIIWILYVLKYHYLESMLTCRMFTQAA